MPASAGQRRPKRGSLFCGFGRFAGGRFRLGLLAAAALLDGSAGELVAALVALAAETEAPAGGTRRLGLFRQQLKHHQAAAVADAVVAQLDDAGVTPLPVGEAGGDLVEQLLDDRARAAALVQDELLLLVGQPAVLEHRDDAAAVVHRLAAGQRDQLLGERPHFLRLGEGRADLPVLEQALHHVAAQRLAVFGIPAELPAANHVTHGGSPSRSSPADGPGGILCSWLLVTCHWLLVAGFRSGRPSDFVGSASADASLPIREKRVR